MKLRLYNALAAAFSCTNERGATRALEGAGYTEIELTGHASFECGNDNTCTGFRAVGPTGINVEGAVGCGYGSSGCTKGCTIRTN